MNEAPNCLILVCSLVLWALMEGLIDLLIEGMAKKPVFSLHRLYTFIPQATAGTRPSWRRWLTSFRSWRRPIPAWFMVSEQCLKAHRLTCKDTFICDIFLLDLHWANVAFNSWSTCRCSTTDARSAFSNLSVQSSHSSHFKLEKTETW